MADSERVVRVRCDGPTGDSLARSGVPHLTSQIGLLLPSAKDACRAFPEAAGKTAIDAANSVTDACRPAVPLRVIFSRDESCQAPVAMKQPDWSNRYTPRIGGGLGL